MSTRVAIIGGGPIGVEAAIYGALAGFDVHLFERGRIGENVRTWGHVGLFTEWKRNRSPLTMKLLAERGFQFPPEDETSTGDELVDYIRQIAALAPLRGRIHTQTEVLSITRERTLRSDFISDENFNQRRAAQPFRIIIRAAFGEKVFHADAVIDATGVYATPNFAGNGGAPCPGESGLKNRIDYQLPDVLMREKNRFANKHSVVVGSGHSAASTLRSIAELFNEYSQTRVTWLVRRDVPEHGNPYTPDPHDSSKHRDALHRRANELAHHSQVRFSPRTVVERMTHNGAKFRLELSTQKGDATEKQTIECDNLVAHTGFRPDHQLWRELQVDIHPATEGVLRLSERVIRENRRVGVGLSTGYAEKRPQENAPEEAPCNVADDPELLRHREPNFFVIGIKSYGRDAGFLMQNGFRQVRDIYKLISGDANLDLYGEVL